MNTKKFTHRKKIYYATCAQWNGRNTEEIVAMMGEGTTVFENGTGKYIVHRHAGGMLTLHIGYWVRIGENGVKKVFTPEEFPIHYEQIPD